MLRRLNFRFAPIGLLLAAGLALAPAQSQTLGNAIAVDASGGVYTGGADAASISKTDGWQIHLGHNRSDAVRALMAAPDGSLYAAGTVEQSGFVAHISAAGERIGWLDLDKAASSLAMDGDGAVYAGGTGFIEKLDASLNLIARIDLSGTAAAIAIRQDGAIFAADDSRLVTYSSTGDVLNTFDFGAGTVISGIALDASGAIFVTGSTSSLNLPAARNSMTGPQDAYVAKIGSGLTVEWSVYVGGSGIDAAAAIATRPDGTLVIAGYTNSSDLPRTASGDRWHGGEDGFTAELDAQGNITASSYFGTPGNDRLQALAIDKHGAAHVAGTSDQLWKGLEPRTPPPCTAATLGVTSLLEGPAASSDSAIVLCSGTWNSSTGTSWIHTSSSGTGNGLMTFTFDSNGGGTRSGSITVSNATLNITQAPTGYVGAGPVQVSTDITAAQNIAVDSSGNVYIADDGPDYPGNDGFITKWTVSNGQASTLITSGGFPYGIAVDSSSNVYISDSTNTNIKEWTYPNGPLSANLISGLSFPQSIALGSSGLYIADTVNDAIKLWTPPSGPVSTAQGPSGACMSAA